MNGTVVINTCAELTRSFPDLPFDTANAPDAAAAVVSRTAGALEGSGYALHPLRELPPDNRIALVEGGKISSALLRSERTAAVLLPAEGAASVCAGGSEHVVIVAQEPGLRAAQAAEDCFAVEDVLARRLRFAYDETLGYITAESSLMGTGLRLRVRLHVPMLAQAGKLPALKTLRDQGLLVFTNGDKPEGDVVEIANASAIGRSEQELCQLVTRAAEQLCAQECEMRQAALLEQPARLSDRVWRALGIMRNARLLTAAEFWRLWSDVRLGAAMGLLPLTTERVDQLAPEALPAHLRSYAEEALEGEKLDECRATRLRELLAEEPCA